MAEKEKRIELTKKDITKTWAFWMLFQRMSQCFERYYGLGVCITLIPVLKKLYPRKSDLSQALTRHMVTFMTDPGFGAGIIGLIVAMEEEKANGAEIPDEMINSIKTGLMGPSAGFGDALNSATMASIFRALFIPFALAGSIAGLLGAVCIFLWFHGVAFVSMHFGYSKGKESIASILSSGKMGNLMTGAGILGAFMMGVMTTNYVKLGVAPEWTLATGSVLNLQNTLDGIMPGLLPTALVLGCYMYLRKGGKIVHSILAIIVIAIIGCILGIF
ncbi:PTS system mannose/fructose/sorbose family transporter subunit IID [Clostridium sp. AM58-1XD]|uniref:PTS system mannose/fructose/sorbose family transporter subunit IID n=1 Tax=Clostridium sp. AM58-1XD TaxID=2292307 RepID=UPI000E539738|nr:PTS system mannose/fructose/sorbose family transporter subunit IID [Clostridium sp. AM58-1XD]RGY99240.1 PTS system mannose/fructose/sorbose family transporter subunit IID [Clostridium sp. AM58-1XD]